MSDLRVYIDVRKKCDPEFAENYDKGFQDFKLGVHRRYTESTQNTWVRLKSFGKCR